MMSAERVGAKDGLRGFGVFALPFYHVDEVEV